MCVCLHVHGGTIIVDGKLERKQRSYCWCVVYKNMLVPEVRRTNSRRTRNAEAVSNMLSNEHETP